jgi:hypothetical protein
MFRVVIMQVTQFQMALPLTFSILFQGMPELGAGVFYSLEGFFIVEIPPPPSIPPDTWLTKTFLHVLVGSFTRIVKVLLVNKLLFKSFLLFM